MEKRGDKMFKGETMRKVRSDKKRAIAAPISLSAYEIFSKLSYVCDAPIKLIGEFIIIEGYKSASLIDELQPYFKRDLQYENRYIFGNSERESFKMKLNSKKRLYMRFLDRDHEKMASLAYSLDSSIQVAASLILTKVIYRADLMYPIMSRLIRNILSEKDEAKLRAITKHLNSVSSSDHITMTAVLSYLLEKGIREQKRIINILEEIDR